MALPDNPTKAPPPKSSMWSTESRNRTPTSSDTPQPSSRERNSQSLSSSAPSTSTRTLRSQGRIDDSDLRASGVDQSSAHDDSSSSSSSPSQAGRGTHQPSSSAIGGKPSGLKKRRRLSVRTDTGQPSRNDPLASAAGQDIPPGNNE